MTTLTEKSRTVEKLEFALNWLHSAEEDIESANRGRLLVLELDLERLRNDVLHTPLETETYMED